jgi:hypothetical protein
MKSSTDSTYMASSNYNRFNYYYTITKYTNTTEKVKDKYEPLPKKEEVHIFDIKDLCLKEG